MRKLVELLTFLIFCLLLLNQIAYAQPVNKYKVVPYLIIPDDWRDRVTPEVIQRYKSNILKSLQVAQDFYSTRLNGHTFTYDSDVVKVNKEGVGKFDLNKVNKATSALNISTVFSETQCGTAALLDQLPDFGPRPVAHPFHSGEVRIFYLVGSRDLVSCGTTSPHGGIGSILLEGEAFINHQSLDSIDSSDAFARNDAFYTVIHELGHTFGLSLGGLALGHNCSSAQKYSCKPGVGGPLGPYPPASECELSIMSYCFQPIDKKGLSNTTYNPEINDIFKSPFINPNNDPPMSTPSIINPLGKIESLSPNPLQLGSELIIKGSGFGSYPNSNIQLTNPEIPLDGIAFEIRGWEASEIKLFLKVYTRTYPTTWRLSVVKNDGERIEAPSDLLLAPASAASVPTPSEVLVSNLNTSSPSPSTTGTSSPTPQACTADCVSTSNQCDRVGVPVEGVCSSGICCKINPTPTPTAAPTQPVNPSVPPSPSTSSPAVDPRIPAGKIPYSWDLDQGCRNLGGTKCFAGSFQVLCTEAGGISIGQGAAGGCPDDTYRCCKYVTSCDSLNGQCTDVHDPTFRSEPTHDRIFGYCKTDLYDAQKSGDESLLCWNKPGMTPQSPNTTPQSTSPSPNSSPVQTGSQSCGDKTCGSNETCIGSSNSNSLGTFCLSKGAGAIGSYCGTPSIPPSKNDEACSSGYCDPTTFLCSTSTQPKKKSITKITINDGKNVKEITSNFDQALSIDLPGTEGVAQTFQVSVTIMYDDGSTPTNLPFTFTYEPNGPSTSSSAPTPPISTDEAVCNAKGGVCQTSCDGTKFSAQVGTCPSKNQLCCATPVTVPSPNASKCPGSGTPQKDWGGPCSPNDKDVAVSASGGTACSVASCYFNPDIKQYCWYNSGTPYADYEGCKAKGVTITTPPPTTAPAVQPTVSPTTTSGFAKTGPCYQPGYDSNICGTNPGGAGGQCESLGQQSAPISCTKTCPNGSQVTGTSISTCGADGCYTNTCSCNASCSIQ